MLSRCRWYEDKIFYTCIKEQEYSKSFWTASALQTPRFWFKKLLTFLPTDAEKKLENLNVPNRCQFFHSNCFCTRPSKPKSSRCCSKLENTVTAYEFTAFHKICVPLFLSYHVLLRTIALPWRSLEFKKCNQIALYKNFTVKKSLVRSNERLSAV